MITTALEFIRDELAGYLFQKESDDYPLPGEIVNVSGFYAPTGNASTDLNKQIQVTLVNVEEERLEGMRPYFDQRPDQSFSQLNSPVRINLYLLFAATSNDYARSLRDISNVISFFQRNAVFDRDARDSANNLKFPNMNANVPPAKPWRAIEKLIFKLHYLTFEQQNNLWASLGSKYLPNVVYQVRLLSYFERNGDRVREIMTANGQFRQRAPGDDRNWEDIPAETLSVPNQ